MRPLWPILLHNQKPANLGVVFCSLKTRSFSLFLWMAPGIVVGWIWQGSGTLKLNRDWWKMSAKKRGQELLSLVSVSESFFLKQS
jgi:hypothetical protein